MLVFSDVQSLCISARLWLQVGSPKRLRIDLNQTVSFPPTLFSSSTLRVYFKSILAHPCTASPLTSVMCSKNFCPLIYLFWVTLNSFCRGGINLAVHRFRRKIFTASMFK